MSDTSNKKIQNESIFGFYSETQYNNNKEKKIYYLNMNDEVVQVTNITTTNINNTNFNDIISLGMLKKHIPNFYIENYGYKYENFKDKMLK